MRRTSITLTALIALVVSIASAGWAALADARGRPARHAAHRRAGPGARTSATSRVNDHGSLTYHSDTATAIIDTGRVYGTIPGQAQVRFDYNGSPYVTASFAIYARGGTLYGKASCRLRDPTSRTPSFSGRLQITGGRGRYAHARGGGEMFGVFHRRGYGLIVHATGQLRD